MRQPTRSPIYQHSNSSDVDRWGYTKAVRILTDGAKRRLRRRGFSLDEVADDVIPRYQFSTPGKSQNFAVQDYSKFPTNLKSLERLENQAQA